MLIAELEEVVGTTPGDTVRTSTGDLPTAAHDSTATSTQPTPASPHGPETAIPQDQHNDSNPGGRPNGGGSDGPAAGAAPPPQQETRVSNDLLQMFDTRFASVENRFDSRFDDFEHVIQKLSAQVHMLNKTVEYSQGRS